MSLVIVRIIEITPSSIKIMFSDNLNENIGQDNVVIESTIKSVSDPQVLSVGVDSDVLEIRFSPIFDGIKYKITLLSTQDYSFESMSGDEILQDGVRNVIHIVSPGQQNVFKDNMVTAATDIYAADEPSVCGNILGSTARQLEKFSQELSTVRSANYISVDVKGQPMTRGSGPTDIFPDGGVYELSRVALNSTGDYRKSYINFDNSRVSYFTTHNNVILNPAVGRMFGDPIYLGLIDVVKEEVRSGATSAPYFSGLNIKVKNNHIVQLISVTLKKKSGELIEYDINKYGYVLKDNKYDTALCFSNANLSDNEIWLSEGSVNGLNATFAPPTSEDLLYVSYIYKNIGRNIKQDSVILSSIESVSRESSPAIVNKFSLNNYPVVSAADRVPIAGGIMFYNTVALNGSPAFTTVHPAFTREIHFDVSRLPSRPGEYSVNYNTGEVYVFGADQSANGTGTNPPATSYLYRMVYIKDVDYTYNIEQKEIALRSTRRISGINTKISFEYEDVFAEGTDYRFLSHIEVMGERVNNKIIAPFVLETNNFPITNVFKIFNETTGEIYAIERFNDTSITFSGRTAPKQKTVIREKASFIKVLQEKLYASDELINIHGDRILIINLSNERILNLLNTAIGASYDTSVVFSSSVFLEERYYENDKTKEYNYNTLLSIGSYCIDYLTGIIYVAVPGDLNDDIGYVNYSCGKIKTKNKHILDVNDVYESSAIEIKSELSHIIIKSKDDSLVEVDELPIAGEKNMAMGSDQPIVVGAIKSGKDGIVSAGSNIFTSNSAEFSVDHIGMSIVIGAQQQYFIITDIIGQHQVQVDEPFDSSMVGASWTLLSQEKQISVAQTIKAIYGLYKRSDLVTFSSANITNFKSDIVSFSGNILTLDETSELNIGDEVVVNYNHGSIYVDYTYLHDEIIVSYEYGNNAIDWSMGSFIEEGQEYFVDYKYGALRDSLLANFGSLTQVPQLTNFAESMDREVYRSVVGGTIQSFIKGPTIPAIKGLVRSFTSVDPNIKELAFNNWTLGRDPIHNSQIYLHNTTTGIGRFESGLFIGNDSYARLPAISNVSDKESTVEMWVRPSWSGIENDAELEFNLRINGESAPANKVFFGFNNNNPTSMPFSISKENPLCFGRPYMLDAESSSGYFVWLDESENRWHIQVKGQIASPMSFDGEINSNGEFYNVNLVNGNDGYFTGVIDDITTNIKQIVFSGTFDGYDGYDGYSGDYLSNGEISFNSGKVHYFFDIANREDQNRICLYKDAHGFLTFLVIDNGTEQNIITKACRLSSDVSGWDTNELHHVAVSWKLNSYNENDELHLFIDGQEVHNAYKYGGFNAASGTFRSVEQETVLTTADRPIVGGNGGATESLSNVFYNTGTASDSFVDLGIAAGDKLYLLDATEDGTGSPNNGLSYNIVSVGDDYVMVDREFNLTLGDLKFSINQKTVPVNSPVVNQDFAIYRANEDTTEELIGVNAANPDYSVLRSGQQHYVVINNGIGAGDSVVLKTLGLCLERVNERVFVYGDTQELKTNAVVPFSLDSISITKTILAPTSLDEETTGLVLLSEIVGDNIVVNLSGEISSDAFAQPSNVSLGKKLSVRVSGNNIDYSTEFNKVIVTGETYSGATEEIITPSQNGTLITNEFWTNIDSISLSFTAIDPTRPLGAIEIIEAIPITESENNGNRAVVSDYYNGRFLLGINGSGGQPFIVSRGLYNIEYIAPLKLSVSLSDYLYIGSDFNREKSLDGTIDGLIVLNRQLQDVRAGESISVSRSITSDYNSLIPIIADEDTLAMFYFDNTTKNAANIYDRYYEGFFTEPSVNESFGRAIRFEDKPYIISNSRSAFNNSSGTLEMWICPMDDTKNDLNNRYFLDISSEQEVELESTNNATIVLPVKASSITSVRLASDKNNSEVDYFVGGNLSLIDSKTISLATALPTRNTKVKVSFVPLGSHGDRISLFKNSQGKLAFFMRANGVDYLLSIAINWKRYTWHKIMAMWSTNTTTKMDRLRLFVDGLEKGSIVYGTGLLYGNSVIYGTENIAQGSDRFFATNVSLTDTFSKIFVGSDVYGINNARALIDNIRFSNSERPDLIKYSGNQTIDISYIGNDKVENPTVNDAKTTLLLNFDSEQYLIDNFSTIYDSRQGQFKWECNVIDSFDLITNNSFLQGLLSDLINKLKAAHTECYLSIIR